MVQSTPLSSLMQACQAKVLPRWCRRQNGSTFLPDVLPFWHGFVMIKVAAVGGHGAGGVGAGSGMDLDRLRQSG